MKYSEAFALIDELDLAAEVEATAEAVIGEYKPERRPQVRASDDLA